MCAAIDAAAGVRGLVLFVGATSVFLSNGYTIRFYRRYIYIRAISSNCTSAVGGAVLMSSFNLSENFIIEPVSVYTVVYCYISFS